MPVILQMRKVLTSEPPEVVLEGITVRTFESDDNIEQWLAVRNEAFAREPVGVRAWTRRDFDAEIRSSWWWQTDRIWYAYPTSGPPVVRAIGTVTLAMRGTPELCNPAVHWLAVLPKWRRRGVGRLLMNVLERYCWRNGWHEIRLETHSAWNRAVRLYLQLGYERMPVDE